jgi:amidase
MKKLLHVLYYAKIWVNWITFVINKFVHSGKNQPKPNFHIFVNKLAGDTMTLRRPDTKELEQIGKKTGIELTQDELAVLQPIIAKVLDGYDVLDQFPDPVREVIPAVRIPSSRPEKAEDPLNGIVRYCSVRATPLVESGILSNKNIGLKDTICVAGLPMTCASRLLYDYTSDIDATVTKRILEAGGHITAVMNTDDFAFSGGGHTSVYGAGLNPVDPTYAPGGSSHGSATAIASNQVDITLGGDQGGSIRIPASFSGIVGHKPTHGLVPYTGIVGFDQTIDHVGPMASTVEDCALMLGVIAGKDDTAIDPRQPTNVSVPDYISMLSGSIKGLKIAIVKEGFETAHATQSVNAAVLGAAEKLRSMGADVAEISIPMHTRVPPLWNAVAIEGGLSSFNSGHAAYQTKGYYNPRLISAMMRGLKTHSHDLSPTAKMGALVAEYMRTKYDGVFYARAQNMSRILTETYNAVFENVDLLLMPTTPQRAHKLPALPEIDRKEHIDQALNMVANTAAFDLTGHPSISVPVHSVDGMPIGLMLTGRLFDDATVLRAAHAYEQSC